MKSDADKAVHVDLIIFATVNLHNIHPSISKGNILQPPPPSFHFRLLTRSLVVLFYFGQSQSSWLHEAWGPTREQSIKEIPD